MRVEDFPLLWAALNRSRDAKRGAPRLQAAISKLAEALQAGEIANQDFIQAKESVNNALKSAWDQVENENHAAFGFYNDRRDAPEKVKKLMMGVFYPQAHTMAGQLKKMESLPQDDPAVKIAMPFWREIQPLGVAVTTLKDKTVKRQPKSEEEKKAERFKAPPVTSEAGKQVEELLNDVVNQNFQSLVTAFTARYLGYLNGFMKAAKEAETNPELRGVAYVSPDNAVRYNDYYSLQWHFTTNKENIDGARMLRKRSMMMPKANVDGYALAKLAHVVRHGTRADGTHGAIVDPDAVEKLKQLAEDDADEIRKMFVVKNLVKIVSVVDGKAPVGLAEATVIGTSVNLQSLEGRLRFRFTDGSGFTVQNSVVWSTSVLGNSFYRFPLTFHDVKLAGGVKMPSPSEQRMNTVFLGKDA